MIDADPELHAETRTIRAWINGRTVSTDSLVAELDYWHAWNAEQEGSATRGTRS